MAIEVEEEGINIRNEYSLHALIKELVALPGDRFEAKVKTYIVDILRGDMVIEIQTRNFTSIRKKLRALAKDYRVRLIFPIAVEKLVIYCDKETHKPLRKRKSPKRGKPIDLFRELMRMPDLPSHHNFQLVLMMIKAEEHRIIGEKKGWRGRGYKVLDRKIVGVLDTLTFNNPRDFHAFLPDELPERFTNNMLAEALDERVQKVRVMTYCLKKMGAIREVGKKGNALIFEKN